MEVPVALAEPVPKALFAAALSDTAVMPASTILPIVVSAKLPSEAVATSALAASEKATSALAVSEKATSALAASGRVTSALAMPEKLSSAWVMLDMENAVASPQPASAWFAAAESGAADAAPVETVPYL